MALSLKASAWCARRNSDSPVLPFKQQDAGVADNQLWFGPKHVGCFVLEIYGPMQLLLWALILPAMVFLGIEIDKQSKEDFVDYHRYSTAIGCVAFAIVLCPFAKALYIIKLLRMEILNFRKLNRALQTQVEEFTKQVGDFAKENDTYKTANSRHTELNAELCQQFEKQQRECIRQEEINTKLSHEVGDLKATVSDLQRVEKQLLLLSNECAGSVEQARGLLTRLERNLKLDTVNTVFLFFDRCDRDNDGKIDASELDLFLNNIANLFKHVEGFSKQNMRASLLDQGGLTLEQAHTLVEAIMLEECPVKIEEKLSRSFSPTSLSRALAKTLEAECDKPSSDEFWKSAEECDKPSYIEFWKSGSGNPFPADCDDVLKVESFLEKSGNPFS